MLTLFSCQWKNIININLVSSENLIKQNSNLYWDKLLPLLSKSWNINEGHNTEVIFYYSLWFVPLWNVYQLIILPDKSATFITEFFIL